MAQQKQHKVIQTNICLKLMKKYKKQRPKETGRNIQYDIQAMRGDPRKMERWQQQREQTITITPHDTATQGWGKIKIALQSALTENYPQKKHIRKEPDPEWAKNEKQWRKEEEWEELQQRIAKRHKLQQRIQMIDKETQEK